LPPEQHNLLVLLYEDGAWNDTFMDVDDQCETLTKLPDEYVVIKSGYCEGKFRWFGTLTNKGMEYIKENY